MYKMLSVLAPLDLMRVELVDGCACIVTLSEKQLFYNLRPGMLVEAYSVQQAIRRKAQHAVARRCNAFIMQKCPKHVKASRGQI